MPAALAVNREAIRVLVLSVGVREAARQMGLNESTVQAWCARGKWLEPVRNPPALPPTMTQAPATSVTNAGDSLAAALAEDSNATKTGFSRMARRVAEAAGKYTPTKALKNSRGLRDVATIAGQVHGWDAKTGEDRRVMINIGILTQ